MQNGNKELIARLNVKFCKYIFINGSLSKEQNEDLNNVINTASNIQEWHVPYELITKLKLESTQKDRSRYQLWLFFTKISFKQLHEERFEYFQVSNS